MNTTETTELKPTLGLFATRWFLLSFSILYLAKHCAWGFSLFHDPDFLLILRARAIEALVVVTGLTLTMIIPFYKGHLTIILSDSTLQAPASFRKFGNRSKSVSMELSDITVSRSLRDRLRGAQIITHDGQTVWLDYFLYAPKAISKLLDEVERRQGVIK
jgi:hypothetical protein